MLCAAVLIAYSAGSYAYLAAAICDRYQLVISVLVVLVGHFVSGLFPTNLG